MSELVVSIPDFDSKIRKIVGPDGKTHWYAIADVARQLGYKSPHALTSKLDPDEKGHGIFETPGGPQKLGIVSRPGLTKLCQHSDKHAAKLIARWINHEVMESVYETGSYTMPGVVHQPTFPPADPVLASLEAAIAIRRDQAAMKQDIVLLRQVQADAQARIVEAEARAAEADARAKDAQARILDAQESAAQAHYAAAEAKAESLKATQEANRTFRLVTSEAKEFCLVTWAETHGVHLVAPQDALEGKLVTAMCKARKLPIGSIRTTRYPGGVNTYPESILLEWLEAYRRRSAV